MNDLEKGWLAGLMDGEGSVCLEKMTTFRRPVLSMTSTDIEILEEVKKLLGGCITPVKFKGRMTKPAWIWKLNGSTQVLSSLAWLEPLMRCPKKKERARHVILNYPLLTKRNGMYSEEERSAKFRFEERFFALDGLGR